VAADQVKVAPRLGKTPAWLTGTGAFQDMFVQLLVALSHRYTAPLGPTM